ncbi:molybdopterin-binding protein [Fusibacter ferrireducens]|uniref:Molybdopterin-binding protein n=1 Tax=Fusibacter ferrireducens TaxID=2785058 RepID=A0ABR9ZUB3_9FIRM|nr:molybdopterin-binding protein [Fusibacter ferrireducens]MBF4693936.1 molybdopterin-binding protein [Fusibacter ferrireducens]
MKKVYILPTGDEIQNGTVLDLDSVEIMSQIISMYPKAEVTRISPLKDEEDVIFQKIQSLVKLKPDLLILIGGSGGGHRHSNSLGKDFTHTALDRYLDQKSSREIYGKNGHLWCKLVCGKKESTLIINVPGPYEEAKAATEAFLKAFSEAYSIENICKAMAQAVYDQYPVGV